MAEERVAARGAIAECAAWLLEARRRGALIELPDLGSAEDAYAVQTEIARRAGGLGAWKVALFERRGEFVFAPILPDTVVASGTVFPPGSFHMIGLEGEIAFRLARPLPASRAPIVRDELDGLVAEVLPAIEIVDTRLKNWNDATRPARIADNMSSGGLVLGRPLDDWRNRELGAPGFEMRYGGAVIGPAGRNMLGDLRDVLLALLEHCRRRDIDLPEGTLVSTGSNTGLVFVDAGETATLECGGRRLVSATFAAGPADSRA